MKATSLSVRDSVCTVVVSHKPVSRWKKVKSAAIATVAQAKRVVSAVGSVATNVKRGIGHAKRSVDSRISIVTGINYEWSKAILTVGSAGAAIAGRRRVRSWAQQTFHDGPGHLKCFAEINAYIDGWHEGRPLPGVIGALHRLRHGHSIEFLPDLVSKFGVRAVPAYFIHIAQDFTTPAGIPLIPYARLARIGLRKCGLSGAVATTCVTANLATVIGAVGTGLIVWEVGKIGYEIYSAAVRPEPETNAETLPCST